ncbi:MAG: SurA N-terminal domain-containing protein [Kiritimatiellae bacterium]|nr:SurA N-terminal domain-containing protein [Kiritimatiellia bacterium]
MKKIIAFALAAVFAQAGASVLDGVAGRVGGYTITIGEVMQEVGKTPHLRALLAQATDQKTVMEALYGNALDELIERRLILKAAQEKKIDMQEWVVDNRIREIVKDSFDGDRNKLLDALAKTRTAYPDWVTSIREDLILAAMRWQFVDKNITATPAEMRREWETNKTSYVAAPSVSVSVILLKPEDGEDVETRGKAILSRIAAGEDFAALAKEFSADSHAAEGGAWKNVNPEDEFNEDIVEILSGLKTGETSPVVNLAGWGFIIRKDAEREAGQKTFAEAYDDVAAAVRRAKGDAAYRAWIERLRKNAFVEKKPMPEL